MASIAPIVIGCNDYLAYGTFFTRAMFRPKIKIDVFFRAGRWCHLPLLLVEVENGLVLHNWGTFVLTFGANLPVPCHNIETTIQLIPMDH